jgi:hypothetical protein
MRYSHRRRDMAPRFLYREYNSPVAIPCGRDFIAAALGCSFAGIEDTSDEKRTLEMRAPARLGTDAHTVAAAQPIFSLVVHDCGSQRMLA